MKRGFDGKTCWCSGLPFPHRLNVELCHAQSRHQEIEHPFTDNEIAAPGDCTCVCEVCYRIAEHQHQERVETRQEGRYNRYADNRERMP